MAREDASKTARQIAARIDRPAWICQEPEQHKRGQYSVVCMSYTEFDEHYNVGNCIAVVLPTGTELAISAGDGPPQG